ncbi:MAG: archaeal proteasome endopeptidase complex subunit alpha [Desulfurococcales archaeon]|nr:archaeal proteasome endopeptidase complex subunit alpha [Desulfurococcales archaeon]
MAFPTQQAMAYDRAATIFSPEGDLYQVRYAFEAVKKGWTSLGIRSVKGVVLAAEKRRLTPLLDVSDIEKIYKVDDHVGVAFAGMGGDGRVLIDYVRLVSVRHKLVYGEQATVEYLAKAVADVKQAYTQHGGVRPFGVALIFGGVNPDGSVKLYRTDPGGQYFSYKAVAIGMGDSFVNSFLEKMYREELSIDSAIKLAIEALFKSRVAAGEEKKEQLYPVFHELIEIGFVDRDEKMFKKLTPEEIKSIVKSMEPELLS